MLEKNQIQIDGNGNITLQNINGNNINIHKDEDANAVINKLAQLEDVHLDALQQIMDKQADRFWDLFKMLLKDMVRHKNIVTNSTLLVQGDTHIGDNINYVIIQPKSSFPKELTTDLPKVSDLDRIIGRVKDLEELRGLLQDRQKVVVVNGLGGVGKTTLAQAYLTKFADYYAHLLWITQSEGDNFMRDLIAVKGLSHNLSIEVQGKDLETLFIETIAALKNLKAKPNLLVIDNANASLYRHYNDLPKPPNWHILATSRERIEHFETKDLDFLSETDAVLLFQQHCQRISDEAAIRSVLKTVDYHTLTIEILAKTAQRHDTSLATLQAAIVRDLEAGVYIQHKGDKVERITSYLLSIFDLNPLSQEEQRLLQHFAALPSDYVPYHLLKDLIPKQEQGIAATLQDLSEKGWLLQKNKPEAYKMHLIVQAVVIRKRPPTISELQVFIKNVATFLRIDPTKDNPIDKFPLVPYGEAVLALFPDATDTVIILLQNNLALVLRDFGEYYGAKVLLEKAMCLSEVNFGKHHPTTIICYSSLGLVLQDLGKYHEAKALLEKAMRLSEANFGELHPTTAIRYSNLGLVLQDLGEYHEAKTLLEKAMQSMESNFGYNHPNTVKSYSNLALVLHILGDFSQAKALLEKAMRSNEANFGENHPITAVTYSNLAIVFQVFGDSSEAKALLEKAMCSNEANFGENHPSTARTYSNLALVLRDFEEYHEAKTLLEKVTQSMESKFGYNHPNTAQSYSNLATVLKDLGEYETAFTYMYKVYLVMTTHFEEAHPYHQRAKGNLKGLVAEMLENGWSLEQIETLEASLV